MGLETADVVCEQVNATEEVHETVLRAVSTATGQSVAELTPLQTAIDVDALDTLFAATNNCQLLQFQYMGFEVTAEPDQVRVQEPAEADTDA